MCTNFHRDNYIDLEEMGWKFFFVVQKSLIIATFQILTNTSWVSFEEDQDKTTINICPKKHRYGYEQNEHDDTPYFKNLGHDTARTDLLKHTF